MLTVEEQRKAEEALFGPDGPTLANGLLTVLIPEDEEYSSIHVSFCSSSVALIQDNECVLLSPKQTRQLNFYLNKALGDIR